MKDDEAAHALQAQQARGPAMQPRQAVYRWGIQAQSFWQDYWARTLAVGLIASFIAAIAALKFSAWT